MSLSPEDLAAATAPEASLAPDALPEVAPDVGPEKFTKGNPLNDLSAREFTSFLAVAAPIPRTTQADVEYAAKYGALTEGAMAEVLHFFTKEHARVLDLFAGPGRFANLAQHSNREATAVDLDPAARQAYLDSLEGDMFAEEQPYHVADVKTWLQHRAIQEVLPPAAPPASLFDFVFMDPPRARTVAHHLNRDSPDLASFLTHDYAQYLADCVEICSKLLPQGAWIALHLDLATYNGDLLDIPGLLTAKLVDSKAVRLRLKKDWRYDKGPSALGNLGIPFAVINVATLLAYQVNTRKPVR